jgi:hypothetical protein
VAESNSPEDCDAETPNLVLCHSHFVTRDLSFSLRYLE